MRLAGRLPAKLTAGNARYKSHNKKRGGGFFLVKTEGWTFIMLNLVHSLLGAHVRGRSIPLLQIVRIATNISVAKYKETMH